MGSPSRVHAQLIRPLRQHSRFADHRHLVLLTRMVAALPLSQTLCFDRGNSVLPLSHCLAARWQRRVQRWLSHARIDRERLYGFLCSGRFSAGNSQARTWFLALGRFEVVLLGLDQRYASPSLEQDSRKFQLLIGMGLRQRGC